MITYHNQLVKKDIWLQLFKSMINTLKIIILSFPLKKCICIFTINYQNILRHEFSKLFFFFLVSPFFVTIQCSYSKRKKRALLLCCVTKEYLVFVHFAHFIFIVQWTLTLSMQFKIGYLYIHPCQYKNLTETSFKINIVSGIGF